MFIYDKALQYPVKIQNTNPRLASIIISQYGGPDGELGASLRYLSQRYSMPTPELKGLLTDIGTEALEMHHPFLLSPAPEIAKSTRAYFWCFSISLFHLYWAHIQPRRTLETVVPENLLFTADLPLLFHKDNADICANQAFHISPGILGNQSLLYIADGNRYIRANRQLCITGIAIHATVNIHTYRIDMACIDVFNGSPVVFPDCPLKSGSQQAIHHDIVADKASRLK